MKRIFILLAIISLVSFTSCKNTRVKKYGGKMTIELKANEKLVNVTWKDDNLWYLTVPMESTDIPKTSLFKEKSKRGILEGEITFKETR
jgi:hypothetical protein